MTNHRNRSWWGWGWEESALVDQECRDLAALIPGLPETALPVPGVEDIDLPPARIVALGGSALPHAWLFVMESMMIGTFIAFWAVQTMQFWEIGVPEAA